ncbi:hypothetical protein [Arcticibacterium luteifluviistationis]|uniref:Uncharacterized protein n=1 Tax=Arcticibacterium luteifluviistationis TaxID=1784714 RepID=A0A2Z4GFY0_9BACT|nr:hypothetical protein [Arcticibacterium luteifluviistationis]AWW00217.1 hypothetical protein DJ013_19390 [Arcticibacterium luteifluviistationis]
MKYLFVLLLSVSFTLKAQTAPEKIDTLDAEAPLLIDMPTYSIELPNTWTIKAGCVEEQCTAHSPTDTLRGYDTYIESVNLTVNKLSSASYTAEKYANFSIGYLPKVVKGFKVLEKKKLSPKSYVISYKGNKNNIWQTWIQYYHVKNSKVYIVTFSAETLKYRHYQDMIEPYLASFKFK